MMPKLFKTIIGQSTNRQDRIADEYRNLIRYEAKIGSTVFGPVPKGTKREFFCLDAHTWVWHEEWTDQFGNHQVRTTHYNIRPEGLIKSTNGVYQKVGPTETRRFKQAAKLYLQRVNQQVYGGQLAV